MSALFVLSNGGHVLAQRVHKSGSQVVLCHLPGNSITPFATWERNALDGATYWGHYFNNEAEATIDFNSR